MIIKNNSLSAKGKPVVRLGRKAPESRYIFTRIVSYRENTIAIAFCLYA